VDAREALNMWERDVAPVADGWLGTTAGVTADNMFIMLTRFGSTQAARRTSDRPEQHDWWTATSKLFARDVVFHDNPLTEIALGGGSDEAGFVQIIQGRVAEAARSWVLGGRSDEPPAYAPARVALAPRVFQLALVQTEPSLRPDMIGAVAAFDPNDDTLTEAAYFTSESAAREGERKPIPAELAALWHEWQAMLTDVRYYDLTEPWLYSPSS
jgi:hypothetical protein